MRADEFAARLSGVKPCRRKRDGWMADCPNCHRPTLNFREGKTGLLVGCIAGGISDLGEHGVMIDGCDVHVITAAIGLRIRDLAYEPDALPPIELRPIGPSSSRVWFTNR